MRTIFDENGIAEEIKFETFAQVGLLIFQLYLWSVSASKCNFVYSGFSLCYTSCYWRNKQKIEIDTYLKRSLFFGIFHLRIIIWDLFSKY